MDNEFLKENSNYISPFIKAKGKVFDINSILEKVKYPDNVKAVINKENQIRKEGFVPYCVVLIKGKIQIGMNPDEIESFCKAYSFISSLDEGIKEKKTGLILEEDVKSICQIIGLDII